MLTLIKKTQTPKIEQQTNLISPPHHWVLSAFLCGFKAWRSWNWIQTEMWLDLTLNILLSLNLWEKCILFISWWWYQPIEQQKLSVYFKEAVKTHKIYKRENAQSFLLQGRFLSQRINHSGFISLWPQDILWAATVQDITCQLCNINSLDGPENRHCGLWSGAVVMCNMQKDEWTVPRMALWKSHAKGFLVRIS